MASLFISRGIHSLIASRDTTLGSNIAWGGITKRDEPTDHKVAGTVFWVLVAVNFCILVPVFFVLVYTIDRLFPTLAIVEADSPPEYELVTGRESNTGVGKVNVGSSSKDAIVPDDVNESSSSKLMPDETAGLPSTPSKPVTSSLFGTLRLLRSSGTGIFKAYRWRFLYNCVWGFAFGIVSQVPYMPVVASAVVASLAATKVETAWTHAVLSAQYDGYLYKKLPSYITILKATAIPLAAEAVLIQVINAIAILSFGKRTGSADGMGVIPQYEKSTSITALCMFLVTFFTLYACLLIPVEVILVRTRAAMLADDVPTMVQLDSSIRVQNEEDLGFMSWLHAWKTFSRASWIRIAKVNAKSLGAMVGTEIVAGALIILQFWIFTVATQPARPH
ncbi:hypothetical protein IFR04_004336 [Cadophora malorum]|uniref:Uncharacterized protein n=1 Tax=Cadophora malorum TaxID=108018 RepID=A0A8H7WCZ2_9HELO|nr:hypothetical protein IFR04_004336 [Cadophora malorum]